MFFVGFERTKLAIEMEQRVEQRIRLVRWGRGGESSVITPQGSIEQKKCVDSGKINGLAWFTLIPKLQ